MVDKTKNTDEQKKYYAVSGWDGYSNFSYVSIGYDEILKYISKKLDYGKNITDLKIIEIDLLGEK